MIFNDNRYIQKSIFLSKSETKIVMTKSSKATSVTSKDTDDKEAGNKRLSFLTKTERELLLDIPSSFLEDVFNYMELELEFPNLKHIYQVINGKRESLNPINEKLVYFQLHQRYILTNKGTKQMFPIIYDKTFGVCITKECYKSPLVPFGRSHKSGENLLVYCSFCNCFYQNKKMFFDGSAFGPNFAHLFDLTFNEEPKLIKKKSKYIPKIFGFKVER